MIEIREVSTKKDIKAFIEFPLKLYKDCPWFVPPLYMDEKKLLNTYRENPDADSVFYLAWQDGKVVGRIQGIIQKRYNRIHNTNKMRFSRFDCLEDQKIADALFAAVEKWGAEQGMSEICDPLGVAEPVVTACRESGNGDETEHLRPDVQPFLPSLPHDGRRHRRKVAQCGIPR